MPWSRAWSHRTCRRGLAAYRAKPTNSDSEASLFFPAKLALEGGGPPRPEAEAPTTDAAEVWAPAVAISQLSAVQLGAFRQNFGAEGLAAARRLGYAALPISKPF